MDRRNPKHVNKNTKKNTLQLFVNSIAFSCAKRYNFCKLYLRDIILDIQFDRRKITGANSIQLIRSESTELKDCITQFTFQSIALSSTLMVVVFGALQRFPLVVLADIPVIFMLMIVGRIGIHKYTSCNRGFGYQLFLEQSRNIDSKFNTEIINRIGWEESLRAWRFVESTIFQKIYTTPDTDLLSNMVKNIPIINYQNNLRPDLLTLTTEANSVINQFKENALTGNVEICNLEYPWFMPEISTQVPGDDTNRKGLFREKPQNIIRRKLAEVIGVEFEEEIDSKPSIIPKEISTYRYHSGTYLRDLMIILNIIQYVLLFPILLVAISTTSSIDSIFSFKLAHSPSAYTFWIAFIIMIFIVSLRSAVMRRRRQIVENELHSIHSCSITWHLVLLTHYKAIIKTQNNYYCDYVQALMTEAQDIDVFKPDAWINKQYDSLDE